MTAAQTPPTDLPAAGYPLAELCTLVGLPARTVRYYVQIGLVDRPVGETRAARYGPTHLQQLLDIKKWTAAGLSLQRIGELLHGALPASTPVAPAPGSVEVRSHVLVAPGVEVVVEPARAALSPLQLRQFIHAVVAAYSQLTSPPAQSGDSNERQA